MTLFNNQFLYTPYADDTAFSLKKFPKFYQEILTTWGKYLSSPPNVLSAVVTQFIWHNEYIKIDNNTICNYYFSQKNLNHMF